MTFVVTTPRQLTVVKNRREAGEWWEEMMQPLV